MSGVCNDCHNHPCVCGMDQAGSELSDRLGAWEPVRDRGYCANDRPWVLRRFNPKWFGIYETMQTKGYKDRRFATEAAAKKAAEIANRLSA